MTERLRTHADEWRSLVGLSDEQTAELIRQDRIDILIDLAGHTANNRLLVFARKPAPVQVTWLGYPNTTGLDTIDYRLTDAFADPSGLTELHCSETLVRLPACAWCFAPADPVPPVSTPPVLHEGHITFGCFNVMPKINEPLLRLWSEILHAVPDSRLLLKNAFLRASSVQQRVRATFEAAGIASDRIELMDHVSDLAGHLACYGRVDIALDTSPYHGTTTTCEALWMGVPVVSLAGETHVSRVGASLLANVGLPELVARTTEEYVKNSAFPRRRYSTSQPVALHPAPAHGGIPAHGCGAFCPRRRGRLSGDVEEVVRPVLTRRQIRWHSHLNLFLLVILISGRTRIRMKIKIKTKMRTATHLVSGVLAAAKMRGILNSPTHGNLAAAAVASGWNLHYEVRP